MYMWHSSLQTTHINIPIWQLNIIIGFSSRILLFISDIYLNQDQIKFQIVWGVKTSKKYFNGSEIKKKNNKNKIIIINDSIKNVWLNDLPTRFYFKAIWTILYKSRSWRQNQVYWDIPQIYTTTKLLCYILE